MSNVVGFVMITLSIILAIVLIGVILLIVTLVKMRHTDLNQEQHSVRRNFPIVGRMRYLLEHFSPEFVQYFQGDNDGKPFSRLEYQLMVKLSKYAKAIIPFYLREEKGLIL